MNQSSAARKRKDYYSCSSKQKVRDINKIDEKLKPADCFCRSKCLQIQKVFVSALNEHRNKTNSRIEIIDNSNEEIATLEEQVFASLIAKDETNLSKRKYKKFRQICKSANLPSYYLVKKMQKKLDRKNKIVTNQYGVYNKPLEKIQFVCGKYLQKYNAVKDDIFIIKLSGDGTTITKSNVNLLNFTFTLINDWKTAMTSKGNYSLGN